MFLWSEGMEPFGHGQEDGAFRCNGQEEEACWFYGQKEWSLLDKVRKMEPFDALVRKKELVVAIVGRHGAYWTWSGRWSFLMQKMVRKKELVVAMVRWNGAF